MEVFYSNYLLKYKKYKSHISKHDGLFSSGLWKPSLLDMILYLLQPYKFLDKNYLTFYNSEQSVWVTYGVNDVMCALMILRTMPMFMMMFDKVVYNSNRSERIW
jgi:hypothetical protein